MLFRSLFLPSVSLAICPLCSIAIVGGLGLSRWLGVDDTISGLWVGGLIFSLFLWFLTWLDKKRIKFIFRWILILPFYFLILFPLYQMKLIDYSYNKIWGYDKFLVGSIVGSLIFLVGVGTHNLLKKYHDGKSYFAFQKIVIPVGALIITSIIFYFIVQS